jgi:transglutaminase-like putative cysteine protease
MKVTPSQAAVSSYRDYWGTRVTAFDMQMPHEHLEVLATTTVEVHRAVRVPSEADIVGWDDLASPETLNQFSDWVPQSQLTGPGEEVLGIIPGVVEGRNPHEAAMAIFAWMRGEMTYMKGSTGVTTNAEEAWTQRQGVCQDLAHLHPRSTADIGETVAGQSHAWLEWWDGEWRSWDPTNHKPAGDFHVTVARGRDYRDVPPLKGILSGGGGSNLSVSVEITRLA